MDAFVRFMFHSVTEVSHRIRGEVTETSDSRLVKRGSPSHRNPATPLSRCGNSQRSPRPLSGMDRFVAWGREGRETWRKWAWGRGAKKGGTEEERKEDELAPLVLGIDVQTHAREKPTQCLRYTSVAESQKIIYYTSKLTNHTKCDVIGRG